MNNRNDGFPYFQPERVSRELEEVEKARCALLNLMVDNMILQSKVSMTVPSNAVIYGTGILKTGIRKWYNPMRWVKGKIYQKSVTFKKVFK